MECVRIALLPCVVIVSSICTEAANAPDKISPGLAPKSSKAFFNRDYPADRRPPVDVLHFKHPYPAVQDSGDFDSDYVKDENSDNGYWKAQQEYDRLRHKLRKEKQDAAEALAKRKAEEKHLKDTMQKYQKERAARDAALKKKQEAKAALEDQAAKTDTATKTQKDESGWSWSWLWDWWPFSWGTDEASEKTSTVPQKAEERSDIDVAQDDTEHAMDKLKDCKEELAKARAQLRDLMDELEKSKKQQTEAEAAADAAQKEHEKAEHLADGLHSESLTAEKEYNEAKEEYMKQKAIVDQLENELRAAQAKVKAQRDAEDQDGGVYNSHTPKSSAKKGSSPLVNGAAAMLLVLWLKA